MHTTRRAARETTCILSENAEIFSELAGAQAVNTILFSEYAEITSDARKFLSVLAEDATAASLFFSEYADIFSVLT